ncbi:MAG: hypothetical protein V3V74_07710 [Nitrosomonadaceae bacterium]
MTRVYSKEDVAKELDDAKFVMASDLQRLQGQLYIAKNLLGAGIPGMIDHLVYAFGEGPHVDIHHERDKVEIARLNKELECATCYVTAMLPVYNKHKGYYKMASEWLKKR